VPSLPKKPRAAVFRCVSSSHLRRKFFRVIPPEARRGSCVLAPLETAPPQPECRNFPFAQFFGLGLRCSRRCAASSVSFCERARVSAPKVLSRRRCAAAAVRVFDFLVRFFNPAALGFGLAARGVFLSSSEARHSVPGSSIPRAGSLRRHRPVRVRVTLSLQWLWIEPSA
jgi:hypothetical protein